MEQLLAWLAHGLLAASWWQIALYTLVTTHVTIACVTIFLHRSQAHRALELHPAVAHVFRFWLWIGTGMVTKQWVAIHRKHHAKCETPEDPHSPQTRGIKTVLWRGAELYRAEAANAETLSKYGYATPDDWIERRLYTPHSLLGVSLMFVLDLALFGAAGLAVWAVQMAWIPFWAAGVVNGLGHYWGYRNFESADASTNLSPIGLLIGGEEMHNNHHTYPTSAKFSMKPWEFDIGWAYIRALQALGLATVRKVPPQLRLGMVKPADGQTLESLISHRYEVMAGYARALRSACASELDRLQAQGAENTARWKQMVLARTWLPRDAEKIPAEYQAPVAEAAASSPELGQWVAMREELRSLWTRTGVSVDQLVSDLQAWCQKAEDSGIAALQEFSMKLRAAQSA